MYSFIKRHWRETILCYLLFFLSLVSFQLYFSYQSLVQIKTDVIAIYTVKESVAQTQTTPYGIAPLGMAVATTRVCEEHGIKELFCRNDLLAIAYAESRLNPNAVGDSGYAIGAFQINQLYHPNTKHIAVAFESSADYTLTRMIRFGYPEQRTYAIQCHNGCNAGNGYVEAVKGYTTLFN